MSARESFDELVSSYLDEALDEEGLGELNALVATRPEYAARFATLAQLHGALYQLAGHPREPVRQPIERFTDLLSIAVAAIIAWLVVTMPGLHDPPIGIFRIVLFWLLLGTANGIGAVIALRMDRLWWRKNRVILRFVEQWKFWIGVLLLAASAAFSVTWGIGLWLGWFPWR